MSRQLLLQTPIEYLKGVGPQRADVLKSELQIRTYEDLLLHYPFRYVDRTKFYKIKEINPDLPYVQLIGKLIDVHTVGERRAKRLVATLEDESGTIELVWFKGIKWIERNLKYGVEYVVFGKPNLFKGKFNLPHPEMEERSAENTSLASALQPVYPTTEKMKTKGLDSKGIYKLMRNLIAHVQGKLAETLSHELMKRLKLISHNDALCEIHLPSSPERLQQARTRIKFEELFFIQLKLLRMKLVRQQKEKGFVFARVGNVFNEFYENHLPFPLTNAQKRVVKEIRTDIGSGNQMNRLLQGDVGSGKTVVALMTMLIAIDNGYQACIMAPTEILANQHLASLSELLQEMNISVDLLVGSTKAAKRKDIHERLREGSLNILVGTHALLEDEVVFRNLGMVVIDEQHRFGVAQRAKMWKKNTQPPHVLVMTATPIPRTLAMTLYGDLDVSVIDELPPGRKPVTTVHRFESQRLKVFKFIRDEIAKGRQVYIVYPLIEESEKLDLKNLMEGYEAITKAFPLPEYKTCIVHGKMKAADKDFEMQRFVENKAQIMVATTVIEVGVNVPNASVMIIENAERFGLSQLHQLRGRVGRGADQSYCVLMSGYKLSKEAKLRLETMVNTNDGFEIAEVDLKLRGPGDMAGTQQSGVVDLHLADLAKDAQLLSVARNEAIDLLANDPELKQEENKYIRAQFTKLNKGKVNWVNIS